MERGTERNLFSVFIRIAPRNVSRLFVVVVVFTVTHIDEF